MRVIYICGAYRDSRGEFYIESNIREAERAALWVWLQGGVALCPHTNTRHFGGAHGIQDETWLKGDLELLGRCDAVWALPSWESSEGATDEVMVAKDLRMPILYNQKDVSDFLEKP